MQSNLAKVKRTTQLRIQGNVSISLHSPGQRSEKVRGGPATPLAISQKLPKPSRIILPTPTNSKLHLNWGEHFLLLSCCFANGKAQMVHSRCLTSTRTSNGKSEEVLSPFKYLLTEPVCTLSLYHCMNSCTILILCAQNNLMGFDILQMNRGQDKKEPRIVGLFLFHVCTSDFANKIFI